MDAIENIDQIKNPEEATELVLDAVHNVIEPNNMFGSSDGRPNLWTYDTSYKRWSNESIVQFSAPLIPPPQQSQQSFVKSGFYFWLPVISVIPVIPVMIVPIPISYFPVQIKYSVTTTYNSFSQTSISERCTQRYPKRLRQPYCGFCKKNREGVEIYTSHKLYENGKVSCPTLLRHVCGICGKTGHTISHCDDNPTKF